MALTTCASSCGRSRLESSPQTVSWSSIAVPIAPLRRSPIRGSRSPFPSGPIGWTDTSTSFRPVASRPIPLGAAPARGMAARDGENAGRRADAGDRCRRWACRSSTRPKAGDRALSYATWTCPRDVHRAGPVSPHPGAEGLEPRSRSVTTAGGIRRSSGVFLPSPRLGSRLDPGGFDTGNRPSRRRSARRAALQRRHVQPLPRLGNHAARFLSRRPTPARRRCSFRPGRRRGAWGWPDRG